MFVCFFLFGGNFGSPKTQKTQRKPTKKKKTRQQLGSPYCKTCMPNFRVYLQLTERTFVAEKNWGDMLEQASTTLTFLGNKTLQT